MESFESQRKRERGRDLLRRLWSFEQVVLDALLQA